MNENNNHILDFFAAYTAKNITQEEFNILQLWLDQSKQNKEQFLDYLQLYKRVRRIGFSEAIDKNKAWNNIVSQLEQPLIQPVKKEKKTRKLYYKYAVAASVLIIVALTIFLNKGGDTLEFTEPIIVNNQIKTGSDKATLTLESGEKVALVKGTSFQTQNAKSNGEEIIYDDSTSKELVYNYLTIPRGGQFQLTLSDNTRVWLNSESQLKYPVSFTDGENREVELVYGEAYFEVSPSTEHQGAGFKVYHNHQEVQVLGTSFNIAAYNNEDVIYTSLIEGSVKVRTGGGLMVLEPGFQAMVYKNNTFKGKKKINTQAVISWKDGVFDFENEDLESLSIKLSRWYNVDFSFIGEAAKKHRFTGAVKKNKPIDFILNRIKDSKNTIKFTINGNTIIIE